VIGSYEGIFRSSSYAAVQYLRAVLGFAHTVMQ